MPVQIFIRQLKSWQATQNAVDRYLAFQASQSGSDAIVQPVSEGQVTISFAGDIKLFRRLKLFGITIACREAEAN